VKVIVQSSLDDLVNRHSQLTCKRTHSIPEVGIDGRADECVTLRICQMAIFAVLSIPPGPNFAVSTFLAFTIVARLTQCLKMG
jgi:hypothetical protein